MQKKLETIAREVGAEIARALKKKGIGKTIRMGADGTPSEDIDLISESATLRSMKKHNLKANILSEEIGYIDNGEDSTLIIDPVDGTTNSLHAIPIFAVSLALTTGGLRDVSHGVVYDVPMNRCYAATRGRGATLNSKKIKTRKFEMTGSLFSVYAGYNMSSRAVKLMRLSSHVRSLGCASLEMCQIANGKSDMYYFNGIKLIKRIRIVDIAASALILREAGGEIYDFQGNKLDMKASIKARANFVALGDRKCYDFLIKEGIV